MLDGVVLDNVASPPLNANTKSPTSKEPLPELVSYTASLNVTVIVELSLANVTPVIVGAVESYVQINVFDALLLLPPESVNLF